MDGIQTSCRATVVRQIAAMLVPWMDSSVWYERGSYIAEVVGSNPTSSTLPGLSGIWHRLTGPVVSLLGTTP